jgi:hypothetical protein
VSSDRQDLHDLGRILDLGFGFFVWAAHFLVIYVGAATACVVQAGDLRAAWILATIAAAAAVVVHGVTRYRRPKTRTDEDFVRTVTVGADAIALVAILWQLFAIGIVPACA